MHNLKQSRFIISLSICHLFITYNYVNSITNKVNTSYCINSVLLDIKAILHDSCINTDTKSINNTLAEVSSTQHNSS